MLKLSVLMWLTLVAFVAPATAQDGNHWHVLIVTTEGKVSILGGFTKFEAEHTRAKLLRFPYTTEEKAAAAKLEAERQAADAASQQEKEKKVRAAGAPCPSDDDFFANWLQAYSVLGGCIKKDGGIRLVQAQNWYGGRYLGNFLGHAHALGPTYSQVEVFQ